MLVLVVDEKQPSDDHGAIARVCRDYDVTSLPELEHALERADAGAVAVLRLSNYDRDLTGDPRPPTIRFREKGGKVIVKPCPASSK